MFLVFNCCPQFSQTDENNWQSLIFCYLKFIQDSFESFQSLKTSKEKCIKSSKNVFFLATKSKKSYLSLNYLIELFFSRFD